MNNPFKIGSLYKFKKLKPVVVPIYVRYGNEWKGTTNSIVDGNDYNFNDITLLCVDIINQDRYDWRGIFRAGDKIVGLSDAWIKKI